MSPESIAAFKAAYKEIYCQELPDFESVAANCAQALWAKACEFQSTYKPQAVHLQCNYVFAGTHRPKPRCGARGNIHNRDPKTLTLNLKDVTCRRCLKYYEDDERNA
jgi:hypothetical protein